MNMRSLFVWILNTCNHLYYKLSKQRTFSFQYKTYEYFYHPYNTTWSNERTVEIPIIWNLMKDYRGKEILEVGNVLSHYYPVSHDILDKYEEADGVINCDVVSFQPSKKYDLIVSISTLEHVGWDEKPHEPMKFVEAIEHLKKLIAPDGKLVVTFPVGHNFMLDELLDKHSVGFTSIFYLKRVSANNEWVEVDWADIRDAKCNYPYQAANGLIVGMIDVIEKEKKQ